MKCVSEEKGIQKYKEGIFTRIKNFLKLLFKKEKIEIMDEFEENMNKENNNLKDLNSHSFVENIKYAESEDEKLLQLQKKYESKEITEADMTPEQVENLKRLYLKQIKTLDESVNNYKQKIINIKKSIVSMN